MHAQPSMLPSLTTRSLTRVLLAALLFGIAAVLGLASGTRAAEPGQGLLDPVQETVAAVGDTTETVAEAAAPIVDMTAPVLDATLETADPIVDALEPAGAGIGPIVEQIEPTLDAVPPLLETGPLAEALAPVVDAVRPIIGATAPIAETIDGLAPVPLVPAPLDAAPPVLDASVPDGPEGSPGSVATPAIGATVRVTSATAVEVVTPPSTSAGFVPHPASLTDAGGGTPAAMMGMTDAGDLALVGSSLGAAIVLALLIVGPPFWWVPLPNAHAPPLSQTQIVPVPPG
jgi:hypothetical protein